MNKCERDIIVKWSTSLSDEELETEYYNAVFDSLGSQTEEMYELGYDLVDIQEREKYERYLCERCSLLEMLCDERGIGLFR